MLLDVLHSELPPIYPGEGKSRSEAPDILIAGYRHIWSARRSIGIMGAVRKMNTVKNE